MSVPQYCPVGQHAKGLDNEEDEKEHNEDKVYGVQLVEGCVVQDGGHRCISNYCRKCYSQIRTNSP